MICICIVLYWPVFSASWSLRSRQSWGCHGNSTFADVGLSSLGICCTRLITSSVPCTGHQNLHLQTPASIHNVSQCDVIDFLSYHRDKTQPLSQNRTTYPQNWKKHITLQYCQKKTKPQPQATCTHNSVKFCQMVSEICVQSDTHTQTYHHFRLMHNLIYTTDIEYIYAQKHKT